MSLRQKFIYAIIAVVAVNLVGMFGYHLIEGWPLFDGLYMTVITLATIGYGETHTLSFAGRVFTIGLIVVSVTILGFLLSGLTQALVAAEIAAALEKRRMFKDISQLQDHYILCGAGRVGQRIVDEMAKKEVDFIVIERDGEVAERLLAKGHLVLIGDATDEEVLRGARLAEAKALISAASSDAENVYIVLTARGMNAKLHIVARANDLSAEQKLRRAGANRVVSPVLIGSHRMAQAALSPAVADFLESTTMTESLDLNFEQIRINPGSPLDGTSLRESGIRAQHSAMIVAIIPHAEPSQMTFNPSAAQVLRAGDVLIAIGTAAGLATLAKIASNQ